MKSNELTTVKIFHQLEYNDAIYNIYGEGNKNTFFDEDELVPVSVPRKDYKEYLDNLKKVRALNKSINRFKDNCLILAVEKRGDMFPEMIKQEVERLKEIKERHDDGEG